MRGRPFANEHLDAFFNPVVDAALVLASFLRAAEAVGLGCCPISVIRDHARDSQRVVGIAGLGHPGVWALSRLAGGLRRRSHRNSALT